MGTEGSSPTWRHGPVLGGEGERPDIRLEPIVWVPKPVPGAARRARRTRWLRQLRWLGASLLAALVVAGTVVAVPLSLPDSAVVADEFRRRADAACAAVLDRVRALPAPDADAPAAERAAALAARMDELSALPGALLAVAGPDDPGAVRSWIDDWDAYVASGHRFVAATEAGDAAGVEAAERDAGRLQRRLDGFALANRMGDCVVASR